MSIAAVPAYLGKDFSSASPGLRFGLLLPIWTDPGSWGKSRSVSRQTWASICRLNNQEKKLMAALARRQAAGLPDNDQTLTMDAVASAPFTTGLGSEHPLENGFAFLNPYGLPYLPGSGVKGVLRQAARELAAGMWGKTGGWRDDKLWRIGNDTRLSMLDVLFGLESAGGESEHVRGALSFWDVIPQIEDQKLMVEIMTPHQSHYYQDGQAPHDSGQPVPITFLTVPPGSGFTFHVACDTAHLQRLTKGIESASAAPDLLAPGENHWKTLVQSAFEHAFEWLGFGAKTAVGYGAMQPLSEEQIDQRRRQQEAAQLHCPWVDETIEHLSREQNAPPDVVLRGKPLAKAWQQIEDEDLKGRALLDIKSRWQAQDWWDQPPGKAARKAKEIYAPEQK